MSQSKTIILFKALVKKGKLCIIIIPVICIARKCMIINFFHIDQKLSPRSEGGGALLYDNDGGAICGF